MIDRRDWLYRTTGDRSGDVMRAFIVAETKIKEVSNECMGASIIDWLLIIGNGSW